MRLGECESVDEEIGKEEPGFSLLQWKDLPSGVNVSKNV